MNFPRQSTFYTVFVLYAFNFLNQEIFVLLFGLFFSLISFHIQII